MKRLAEQTLYELLEVPPDAPPDTLRAAIERARSIFGPNSLAMYSLMSTDEAELMNRRIEEAGATLLDPEARARYDAMLQASSGTGATAHRVPPWTVPPVIPARPVATDVTGESKAAEPPAEEPAPAAPVLRLTRPPEPQPPPAEPSPAEPPPPAAVPAAWARPPIRLDRPVSAPASTPVPAANLPQAVSAPPRAEEPIPAFAADAPWTGEMLRRVREARGIPIQIVAERTKVTRHHLENIEADRFALLPAPVYLRGILFGLARELRLDGQKVARSYLERMAEALNPPPAPPGPKRG